jgi:hypothetical protein
MRFLIVLSLLLCAGCSQNALLTRQDYQKSRDDFARASYEQALLEFPRGREDGGFIVTMEKTYLSLLQGKPEIAALQKQAAWQENKVRYHVSREARTFFYVQTPEDYYPGEHEVIWMHLLLGWGYAQQGKYTDSCVEARIAGSLLTLPWSPNGHFDDPTLRLFLAGLWTMCGEWREARVDLRAARELDNSLAWAGELAERDRPPAHLFIVLGGTGPDVAWDPEFKANFLRSSRHVKFVLQGHKSELSAMDAQGTVIATHLSPDAGNWYKRYQARESELHEIIEDSAYGGKVASNSTLTAGWIAATASAGILVAAGGTALGVAILRVAVNSGGGSGSDALVKLGVGVIAVSWGAGWQIAQGGYEDSTAHLKKELDPGNHYRYVRFLPEYLWMGWSDQPIAFPVKLATPSQTVEILRPGVVHGATVTVAHMPDGRTSKCVYRMSQDTVTYVAEPDIEGNCPQQPDW